MFNSLIEKKNRVSNFSSLSDGEVNYHLHIANTHSGVTQAKSKDMCKISRHMEEQSQHEKAEALEAIIDAFNRALQKTLSNTGSRRTRLANRDANVPRRKIHSIQLQRLTPSLPHHT